MIFDVDESIRKRAKTPHELSMVNLVACHLIAAPASIVLDIGFMGFLIPLLLSLSVIAFIWYRSEVETSTEAWFVAAHWRLSANRTRILLVGYAISAVILGMAMLATSGSSKGEIMMVAITRVAVVPTLITVMICFVLESGSIYQAGRGDVPESIVKRMPPPDNLPVLQQAAGQNPAN
ncbi:MAG: hypothetical protein G8D61_14905 [gamma proteobacterium symbiont of Ctena orbiculata]|nr:hypothetical protein [Candidatus Thiodiazotropha sp. (ex Lucina pensylvanica)]MBT3063893.1 hypothetical protein [Candidatus Thiodiazotropha sp. (ex Lucina pensylvanica)]MBV2094170.1 hypothetical protein [Candidatus Thiodiazotropha sp. (ex Codakia orbicularis)]PUB72713.1 MAG: hypothetical protein DBP03_15635 [gamma proteobacterium symbiont of Ctena orbiculata]PUB78047.1 MAG: hypothetical protein DBO99_08085 [gamma proteobacterium symbiont of Ctena orbiculata]